MSEMISPAHYISIFLIHDTTCLNEQIVKMGKIRGKWGEKKEVF